MATIKQSMSRKISADASGVKAVVNEANDGVQAVPTELVIKAADDSTFTQISDVTPMPVKFINSGPTDVVLQNNATVAGNGVAFTPTTNKTLTFVITGTSASRSTAFEMADPVSGVYVPATAFSVTDPTKFGPTTTGGSNTLPEGWQLDVPAGWSFRARLSAPVGGNVSIKGKAI